MYPGGAPAGRWLVLASVLAASVSGCARSTPPKAGDGDASGTSSAAGTSKACEPQTLGLGDAKPVATWKAPAGCTPRVSGEAPVVV
ncbi:MAG: hypothetical protein HOO96_25650, partial [Polyangiaceae bacterium]|nr:hypothetical protein [Polyangiaceae bacterium]